MYKGWDIFQKLEELWPAVEEGKDPIVVFKEGENVDGDRGADEHQVEDSQCHQQSIECVFPQLGK